METKELTEVRMNLTQVREKLIDFNNDNHNVNRNDHEKINEAVHLIDNFLSQKEYSKNRMIHAELIFQQVIKLLVELF